MGREVSCCTGDNFVRLASIDTPLGVMTAGATAAGICLLEFTDPQKLQVPVAPAASPHLTLLEHELATYFAHGSVRFTVPLVVVGTEFQLRVWKELRRIPYGETRSYGKIAEAIGRPRAMRAVGRANGTNRIAILIPCHRVVNKDGSLGGYAAGSWRKQRLLALEGIAGSWL